MPNPVSWNYQMSVREGRRDDAQELIDEMIVTATKKKPGDQGYEWFLSQDGKTCHSNEKYVDSDAVMAHLGNFGSKFAERFLACFEPTSFSV